MRPLNIVMAVIGGAIAGAAVGMMFAPDKGCETRKKVCECLKNKGICLKGKKLDELVSKITAGIKTSKQ